MNLNECLLNEFFVPFSPEVTNAEQNWTSPEIRPSPFDQNLENYFKRIGMWGRINIYHTDPENKIRKQFITQGQFIKLMSSTDLHKLYGKFQCELRGINECDFIRVYLGMDGKAYKEVFKIKVDLKPELKRGFNFWDGLFS